MAWEPGSGRTGQFSPDFLPLYSHLTIPAKAGTHVAHGYRPSPVWHGMRSGGLDRTNCASAARACRLFRGVSRLVGEVALDGARRGGLALGAEGFPVLAHPVHRLRAPGAALLKARQDVAREQFVGALGRLPIGPIVRQHQDAAKAAGLGPVVLQDPQRVVRRADRTTPAFVDL